MTNYWIYIICIKTQPNKVINYLISLNLANNEDNCLAIKLKFSNLKRIIYEHYSLKYLLTTKTNQQKN